MMPASPSCAAVARAPAGPAGCAPPQTRARQEPLKLRMRVVLLHHLQPDVGPVEAGDEAGRLPQPQLVADVVARVRIGGGGERDERHPGKPLPQPAELHVLRPEVVPPLRDAVRLVDGDESDAGAWPRPARRRRRRRRRRRQPPPARSAASRSRNPSLVTRSGDT